MGLVEECADFVAGVEAGDFGANPDDGAGPIGERVYGGGAGEGVLSFIEG